jgi:CRP-like cAMP-binding protein
MERHSFNQGEVIFREGQFSHSMYQVTSGHVGIFGNYDSPHAQQLATLGTGEFFGEMGLAECYPRSATAVALDNDTEVDEISPEEFSSYFEDQPETVLAIMRTLSKRLRDTNARYLEARHAVHDAIEAESSGRKKSKPLADKLTEMIRYFRRSTN